MKALSVKQPWASLIADGLKSWEIRTWTTSYRGPLIICAGQRPSTTLDAQDWAYSAGLLGTTVAVVRLNNVRLIEHGGYSTNARCRVKPGEYAWELTNVRKLPAIQLKGRLGLFDVSEDLIERIANRPDVTIAALRSLWSEVEAAR